MSHYVKGLEFVIGLMLALVIFEITTSSLTNVGIVTKIAQILMG